MGRIPKPETARDTALIADYLDHKMVNGEVVWTYSIAQLGLKYARKEGRAVYPLTATRIHQILDKYGISKNRIIKKSER